MFSRCGDLVIIGKGNKTQYHLAQINLSDLNHSIELGVNIVSGRTNTPSVSVWGLISEITQCGDKQSL